MPWGPALLGRDYLSVRNQAGEDLGRVRANSANDGSSRPTNEVEQAAVPLVSANKKSSGVIRSSSKRIEISIAALTIQYHFMKWQNVKRLITVSINPQHDAQTFLA